MFTHRAVLEKAPKASGVYSIFNAKRWVYAGESDDIQRSLFNRLNRLLSPQRHAREKIIRHSHAGHDLDIDEALVNQQLTDGVIIFRPM